jgi:signal transduction histidine kinase
MRGSASRMQALIDNLLDLARSRLGGGLTLNRDANEPLEPVLREVIAELQASQRNRIVQAEFALVEPVNCDRPRIATVPDSPPTIAQSIPRRFIFGIGPSNGSSERNLTCAPVSRR